MKNNVNETINPSTLDFLSIFKQLYDFVIPKGNVEIPVRILIAIFFLFLGTLIFFIPLIKHSEINFSIFIFASWRL